MKRTIINIPLITVLLLFSADVLHSQDTNTIKFFPLKVGNIWIYQCSAYGSLCGCVKQKRIKTISSIIINGKKYFTFQKTERIIGPLCGECGYGLLPFDTLRVDSISCNIFKYTSGAGCSYTPHEILLDSLKARLNDTIKISCGTVSNYRCVDTSSQNILGSNRQTRFYSQMFVDSYWGRGYAKGIGLKGASSGGQTCYDNTNLLGCVIDGIVYGDTSFPLGIKQISSEVPDVFSLFQNYPNPFNPSTMIQFTIPPSKGAREMTVKLVIYDILGREMTTLVNEQLFPGTYEAEWDGSNYPSGVYFYKLITPDFSETKKMVLIK